MARDKTSPKECKKATARWERKAAGRLRRSFRGRRTRAVGDLIKGKF